MAPTAAPSRKKEYLLSLLEEQTSVKIVLDAFSDGICCAADRGWVTVNSAESSKQFQNGKVLFSFLGQSASFGNETNATVWLG